jgi:hypothetical protein
MNNPNDPIYNFSKLVDRNPIGIGLVSKSLTGLQDEYTYFAVLDIHRATNEHHVQLTQVLHSGIIERGSLLASDEAQNAVVYGLMAQSPWFPLGTGNTPHAALAAFVEKVNQPWMSQNLHLLPLLTKKVLMRWHNRSLVDKESGDYKFHIDMQYVYPEEEKVFV